MTAPTLPQDQIDQAIFEADKAWRIEGKAMSFSKHLAIAMAKRIVAGQEWISVEDELPEHESELVLFYSPDPRNPVKQATGMYRDGRWMSDGFEFINVTHWKRLDEPPVETFRELVLNKFAVVSNPGTDHQQIEQSFADMHSAVAFKASFDTPTDVMRVLPNGGLTTEL